MDTTPPPLLMCDGGPWAGRMILRPGRSTGFNIQAPGGLIACYDYVPNTTSGPRWIYRGTRTPDPDEGSFFHRYYYRQG